MNYNFKDTTPHQNEPMADDNYYTDFTELDKSIEYSLAELSELIKTKGNGKAVRDIFSLAFKLIEQIDGIEDYHNEKYDEYYRQFTDVITELSEEKDYHSLPEIAGARGGFDTLGERLDSETFDMSRMSQDVKEAMTGGSVAVVGVGAVGNENLKTKSVSADKTNFVKKVSGLNLFNKTTVSVSTMLRTDDGATVSYTGYATSDYIEVEPNQPYIATSKGYKAQYDESYNYIGMFTSNPAEFTTSPTTRFIRMTILNGAIDTQMLVQGSTLPQEYTPFVEYYEFTKTKATSEDKETTSEDKKTITEIMSQVVLSDETKQIKLIGDSITAGTGGTGYATDGEIIFSSYRSNPNGHCWANTFRDYMQEKHNCVVKNYGVSGLTSAGLLGQKTALMQQDDDIIICMIGTNNRTGDKVELYNHINDIYNHAKGLGKEVIFMSCVPSTVANEEGKLFHMEDVDHIIMKATTDLGIEYISVYKLFIDYCQSRNIDMDTLFADGVHPNNAGYDVMFYLICNALGFGIKRSGATW